MRPQEVNLLRDLQIVIQDWGRRSAYWTKWRSVQQRQVPWRAPLRVTTVAKEAAAQVSLASGDLACQVRRQLKHFIETGQ